MEIFEMGARELARAIRQRQVSAQEVAQVSLERAETVGAQVGAFTHLSPDLAMKQATAADAALERGDAPAFAGVPCPIKDLAQVAGEPWEAGAAVLKGTIAEVDDAVVTLLREAGTVMIGKTTTPEFGFPPYTEPVAGPKARTPWDLSRTAGGSSGGAAAAVASGVVPAAHGSDGGGSIRIPAAACGIVGMKPSRGRVSFAPSADGVGLATNGVLTRNVRDSAAFLDVLAKPMLGDPWPIESGLAAGDQARSPQFSGTHFSGSFLQACDANPGRLRVGLLLEPLAVDSMDLHPQSRRAAELTAKALEDLGHSVDVAPRPMGGADWETFMPLWSVTAAQLPIEESQVPELEPLTRWLREIGQSYTGAQYAGAIAGMQLLSRRIAQAWANFDVIVTPVLAPGPLRIEDLVKSDPAEDFDAQRRFTPWTSIWNMTGAPAISLPVHAGEVEVPGEQPVELPFSAMLGAVAPGKEAMLFALSAQLEETLPWHERQMKIINKYQ